MHAPGEPVRSESRALLDQWLARIQQIHPREIELGLGRLRPVARTLGLHKPAPIVITVTGTNGKGSHVATLDALGRAAGFRVGSYTSPHLLRYNERICVQGKQVSDEALIGAFERIEVGRGDISLSFFEFGTLAAFIIFQESALDFVVLEVGLGGRLDAVNLMDADVAVVSSIDLDHQEWLGDTREAIALEKAGIFRAGKPVVCAEEDPPSTLFESAYALSCPLYLPAREFSFSTDADGYWNWQGVFLDAEGVRQTLELVDLPIPGLALPNVACALQAFCISGLVKDQALLRGILPEVFTDLSLPGRQQWLQLAGCAAKVLLDVAHNPHAAVSLAHAIEKHREGSAVRGQVRLVLAMMADKDHAGFYRALEKQVDFWYIAHFNLPRCMPSEALADRLRRLSADGAAAERKTAVFRQFLDVKQAFHSACSDSTDDDIIVVAGSFITVAEVMSLLPDHQRAADANR
jgi:dihydrofolate synthase / folylpolyglutamate synthase